MPKTKTKLLEFYRAIPAHPFHAGGILPPVFWPQATVSFLLWIVTGILISRRSLQLKAHAFSVPKVRRALLSSICFIGAMLLLFFALQWVALNGGMQNNGLLAWAWIVISVSGVICVCLTSLGMAFLVSIALEAAAKDHKSRYRSDS